jgi:pimeloyl-ACP methyl ester carboxylesterase
LRTDAHRHRPPPADSELAHAIAVLGRLVDDMAKLSGLVRDRHSALPLVLVGHSLGSFASQQYTLDHSSDIAGVALSGNDGAGRAFSAADRWADSSSVNHKLTRNIAARVTHAFDSGPFSVNPVTQRGSRAPSPLPRLEAVTGEASAGVMPTELLLPSRRLRSLMVGTDDASVSRNNSGATRRRVSCDPTPADLGPDFTHLNHLSAYGI